MTETSSDHDNSREDMVIKTTLKRIRQLAGEAVLLSAELVHHASAARCAGNRSHDYDRYFELSLRIEEFKRSVALATSWVR